MNNEKSHILKRPKWKAPDLSFLTFEKTSGVGAGTSDAGGLNGSGT